MDKIIIIGLGNPGEKFKNTRHNVGFAALDEFAEKESFPDFKLQKKYEAFISELNNILLVKPQTFMNESGKSVKKIIANTPLETESLIVVHDDTDLPVGKIKIVKDRGSAGHKGIESIIQNIGNGYIRIRIGVGSHGHPEAKKIVLEKFPDEEKDLIKESIDKSVNALKLILTEGLERAMSQSNK